MSSVAEGAKNEFRSKRRKMSPRNIYSERVPVLLICEDESLVHPEFKKSCDVNEILKRYTRTGALPLMQQKGVYDDFSSVPDYQQACNTVIKAQEQFNNLPSEIRKRFENEPEKFLEYVADESNLEEMYGLGMAIRPSEQMPGTTIAEPEEVPPVAENAE